jgi:hypothetical protein
MESQQTSELPIERVFQVERMRRFLNRSPEEATETALVLSDSVESMLESLFAKEFCRYRVHEALNLGDHGYLVCWTENDLRSCDF